MVELYGREEFLSRHFSNDNNDNHVKSIQKPLFLVSVIKSKFYDDYQKMFLAVLNAVKNKIKTHEVRIYFNASANPAHRTEKESDFIQVLNCIIPPVSLKSDGLMDVTKECLASANAVITFDSTKEGNKSELVEYAKNFAARHNLPIKSY